MSGSESSERSTTAQAWVGDRLVPTAQAQVSVFDRGFRSGEGVFETVRAYRTHPFRLGAHLDRAAHGARILHFDLPPRPLLNTAIMATVRSNAREGPQARAGGSWGEGDLALRVTVTPGLIDPWSPFPGKPLGESTLVVTAQPLAHGEELYRVGVSAAAVPWARELPGIKSVSYLGAAFARREARRLGAEEALLTDAAGLVLEGSHSNLFTVVSGRLITPPPDAGILPGVTRAVTLEVAAELGIPVLERPLPLAELLDAEEAFLTASTRELVPLVRVNGKPIGSGSPGPVTSALHEGYRAEVRREMAASRG
ncbi:MAG: aminotransferase class IV [Actinomycetota bacterium]|nr:aminotransferase class IV [Actinomycetota bacterium]